jgi:PBP1b-binding outer membrane lipoprotein LpoB
MGRRLGVVIASALLLAGCGGSHPQTADGYKAAVQDKYAHCIGPGQVAYHPQNHTVTAFTKRGLLLVVKVSGDRDHTRVERGVVC